MMDTRELRNSIEQVINSPTISGVARRAMELASSSDTSLLDLGAFIARDGAIVTRVLKTVNSVIYGIPRRISSPTEAVLFLGLDAVRGLLLHLTVFDLMKETMVGLWEHSAGCAIASRLIARMKGFKDPEEAAIYGLLHDVGKTILLIRQPQVYARALEDAKVTHASIRAMETEYFGVNHATAGAWLIKQWRFPRKLVEVIKYHHAPQLAKGARLETAIAHLADILVRGRGFGFAGDHEVPPVDPLAWALIGLSKSDLRDVLKEMEDLLEEAEELTL
jgi:putative nucleotidyltransferase with HDIG domain